MEVIKLSFHIFQLGQGQRWAAKNERASLEDAVQPNSY